MKKVLLVIVLFCIGFAIKAAEPTIKFYLQDGNTIQYNINDITDMSFVKSQTTSIMAIYTTYGKTTYDINDITSIEISTISKVLIIEKSGSFQPIQLVTIDSINFVPKLSNGIAIGPQYWMEKNLDVEYYRNGDPIPQVTDSTEWVNLKTGAWCYYNNDPANGAIYGKLYNWYAVNDPRGLAPIGWRVPHNTDLTILINSLGGENVAGGKLKEAGTVHWQSPNTDATNEYGFTALPGGARYPKFSELGFMNFMWTQDNQNTFLVYSFTLSYDKANMPWGLGAMTSGFSVRCVLDYNLPVLNQIFPAEAAVGENIEISGSGFGTGTDGNGSFVTFFNSVKPNYDDYVSWSDTKIIVKVPQSAETGKVSVTVNHVKSNEAIFIVKVIDPDAFETLPIGTQNWMSRNLNVDHYRNGDSIPQVKDFTTWKNLTTGAWCYYNNDPKNEAIYGKLYNWYAVNDPRGLAPNGWHVPREEEWTVLINYLGGFSKAGASMKSTGNMNEHNGLWKAPNWGATNSSQFTALPAGYRPEFDFSLIHESTTWWSATEYGTEAVTESLYYMEEYCMKSNKPKALGCSVRCIKD